MNYRSKHVKLQHVAFALPAMALALGGCSGDDTTTDPVDTGPLIAISNIVFSPDLSSRTEHIDFANSIAADGVIDAARKMEITSENSTLWASTKKDEFFMADAGTGSVIKFGIGTDGKIKEIGKVGFSAYGATAFYWTLIVMVSDTKAFLFDEITLQGFIWNPTDMTITKNMDLSSQFNTDEGGMTFAVWRERAAVQIGQKYYVAFKYFDYPSATALQRSGILIMDAANDTFTAVEHPMCTGLSNSILGDDGLIYMATGIIEAGAYFAQQMGATPPCMVRFDPQTDTFDMAFNVDLGALAGMGKFVGSLIRSPGGEVYTRSLVAAGVPMGLTNPLQIAGAPLWETYKIDDVTNPMTATTAGLPLAGGLLYPFPMDGKTYVVDADLPAGKSWFVDLSVDPPARTLEVTGWGYYAVRVR